MVRGYGTIYRTVKVPLPATADSNFEHGFVETGVLSNS